MGLNSAKLEEIAENYAAAWSSKSPEAVASYYADDGQISINRGDTSKGRGAIAEMAAGFYSEFPDLVVHCDDVRASGTHAIPCRPFPESGPLLDSSWAARVSVPMIAALAWRAVREER